MMTEDYSKSKKKTHKVETQKLMMKIGSTKNMSGIGCVILLGGALITAAAMGSAFLISRKHKKSTDKITKKERNDKIEDESSNKGQLQPSSNGIDKLSNFSNGTDKLCLNDNDSTSLISTPCFIQDEKPKLGMSDEKRDTLSALVSDHPKEEENSPSFNRLPEDLLLSETKISLLPHPDQELDEVSEARTEVIQGNEKTEVLEHVHQDQATIFSNPALQMDNRREFSEYNDKGEPNEQQHTDVIDTDNLEEGSIQEKEKQATGDQEISTSNEHEPLNSAFELMEAVDEDEVKDHMQSMYFEEQCADVETQIDQVAKKCDLQMKISAEESDQANSCYEEATSENSPCSAYSIIVPNLAASGIRNASIDDEHSAEAYEDEDKSHMQIMYFEDQCADAETKIDQIAKECNVKMQTGDEQVCSNENDQANSCYEEAISENNHCGTYSMDVQNLAAPEIRNASIDDQNSAEVIQVIKETNVVDPAASGEQRPEADYSPIKLVENDIDKDDATQEVEDGILEGARNSSEQSSHSDKIWPADSNQELLLEPKEEKVKDEEKGTKTKANEACSVENCKLKSTQNDFATTSCQQTSNGKDDSTVNVIDTYRTKLMYLDDIAAITRGRRVLLGALLVLIWYFCLNAFFLPV